MLSDEEKAVLKTAKENYGLTSAEQNILVNLIEEQEKIINEMAEFLEDETTVDDFCNKENCYADDYVNGHCEKCLNCIIEYFTKKVGE